MSHLFTVFLKESFPETEICRTAVDIQGLFTTGTGRAPSAAGQPEQVIDIIMKNFFEVQLSLFFQLYDFSLQEEEESEEAEEVQVEDSEEGGVRIHC